MREKDHPDIDNVLQRLPGGTDPFQYVNYCASDGTPVLPRVILMSQQLSVKAGGKSVRRLYDNASIRIINTTVMARKTQTALRIRSAEKCDFIAYSVIDGVRCTSRFSSAGLPLLL